MGDRLGDISEMTMYRDIIGFPEQIEMALRLSIDDLPKASKVCICGIGASALVGDIMSDFADGNSDIPVPVIRGIDLPEWIGPDTLVIAVSYSGNTKEVLCQYDKAKERGCNAICITSGGGLMDRCLKNGDVLVEVPEVTISRSSFGYLLGFLAAILEDLEICRGRTELMRMVDQLKMFRDSILVGEDNVPSSIAKALDNKIPVIYGLSSIRSSTIRWKTQINENSKMIAFCGTLPEFNHNEIIGWSEDASTKNFILVILYDEDAPELMKIMTDTSMRILKDIGLEIEVFHVNGSTNMEKNLKCIMLGDIVSLYLAFFRNVDPCSVDAVSMVREHLDPSE